MIGSVHWNSKLSSDQDRIDEAELRGLLQNPKSNSSHFISDCPFCSKEQHFYINKTTQLWDCKKCGEEGNIRKLLFFLNKAYLLKGKRILITKKLQKVILELVEEEIDLELKTVKLPIGFKRIFQDDYLESRGFTELDYRKFQPGITKMISKYKDYIIFPIIQNNKTVGFISRIRFDSKQIKELEHQTGRDIPRYKNSDGSQKKKILGGYDEIQFDTETLILVEGMFDKKSVDHHLKLDFQSEIKCVFTLGKSVSDEQIALIRGTNVKNIVLIQDPDAAYETRQIGVKLNRFFNTKIGFSGDKDLGDSNKEEIKYILNNLENPIAFGVNKVKRIKLK